MAAWTGDMGGVVRLRDEPERLAGTVCPAGEGRKFPETIEEGLKL